MPNSSDSRVQQLMFYLHHFIEIMRRDRSPTWFLLVKAVNGKSAVVGLDDVFLFLSAHGGTDLKVTMQIAKDTGNPNFYSRGQVLKDIISGKHLLDKAIKNGQIYVRGDLVDLLQMYHLVLNALVDGNTNREYLKLWLHFESNWKPEDGKENCWRLEDQLPDFKMESFQPNPTTGSH